MNYVISKQNNALLRYGACNFINDGSFDSTKEYVVVWIGILPKAMNTTIYYWNSSTLDFQETPV